MTSADSSLTVSTLWGIVASLSAGILNAFAFSIQKRALNRTPSHYCSNALWWRGFLLLILAEVCGGVAFGLLPGSIVAALGGVSVLVNALLAIRYQGEAFGWRVAMGTVLIVAGSALLGAITPSSKEMETAEELEFHLLSSASALYHAIVLGACIILHSELYDDDGPWSSSHLGLVGLASYAALISSLTAVWFRAGIVLLFRASTSWDHWIFYGAGLIAAVTGAWAAGALEPRGLRRFPQSRWVPMHFVSCLLWFGVAGVIVYDDEVFLQQEQVWFVMGVMLILGGVTLVEYE